MTILGILAAIVSISLLGVTGNAHAKAAKAELVIVQSAMDEMLADQQVLVDPSGPIGPACIGKAGTKDMAAFPVGGALYTSPGTTFVTFLATHYLRQAKTTFSYTCDSEGKVIQGP